MRDLETWLDTFVSGRHSSPKAVEGKVVWVLAHATGDRRVCATLSREGCRIGGDEPSDANKLLIQGDAADMTAYLRTADVAHLEKLQFRGDTRLWETLLDVASQRRSAVALRAQLSGAHRSSLTSTTQH